jgi:hypothetical protein
MTERGVPTMSVAGFGEAKKKPDWVARSRARCSG